jgi:hypothetical protein
MIKSNTRKLSVPPKFGLVHVIISEIRKMRSGRVLKITPACIEVISLGLQLHFLQLVGIKHLQRENNVSGAKVGNPEGNWDRMSTAHYGYAVSGNLVTRRS